ncbi:MAG: HEAT repeat domain-containing protein, partial [Planctomycetes bacterium]|nr:HEAT repeat domain-containing protein [Planctomycetota bacterium]
MLRAIAAIVLCSAAIWLTPAALAAEAGPPAPPPAGPLAVSTISPGLLDEALTDQAAAALVSIGGEAAAKALRDALPKAKGRCRLAILQGLGVLGDAASVPDFIQAAADPDRDVRLTAIAALGNTGDPAAANTLWLATTAPSAYEQSKAADALFTLAERLAKAGNRAAAERICAMMLCIADMPEMRHIRCAAIRGLARVLGAGATDDLATVMQLDDLQVRAAAVEAAAAVPGDEVTAKWVEQLRAAPPELKVEILGLL